MNSEQRKGKTPILSFIVPCLNEEKNIIPTLCTIKNVMQTQNLPYEIIVIDDGSQDQTSSQVEIYMKQFPQESIRLLKNETNHGYGYCYIKGATDSQGEYLLGIPGDNTAPEKAISSVLKEMGKAEIITSYIENPQVRSLFRRAVSYLFTTIVNLISGEKLIYYNGVTLHKRVNVLRNKDVGTGFGFQAELLAYMLYEGCTYKEVPYPTIQRPTGKSSAFKLKNILSVTGSLFRIFGKRFSKHKRTKQPF